VSAKLFLDTTIQIERLVGSRRRQAELRRTLAEHTLLTSTYVLGEYLRTLVADATRLYHLVQTHEHLDDVLTAIAQHVNKRQASRMLLLWANVRREGAQQQEYILDTLEGYVTFQLVGRFLASTDELLDSTGCGLAGERPMQGGDVYRLRAQCTRQVKECFLPEFLTEYKVDVRAVADGLGDHADPALARMAALATQLLDDPDAARGRNCTWYLGGLIIALECPPDAALVTTNRRHFEPLCGLLDKTLCTTSGCIDVR
jgi:predicted nucleic acid-binding protein